MNEPGASGGDVLARGARGAVVLALRQVLVQAIGLAAAVVLARFLTAAEFGVYGIAVFLMQFLVVFGDAGLAAGLVREAAEPDERDWRAVFTFQQLLVAVVAAAGIAVAPSLAPLAGGASHLVPALLAALLLASFQTTPVARLERHLAFDRLAVVEVAQALAFHGTAVACALAGLGADSMAAALVARAAAGAALVQVVAPWRPAWHWEWARVRRRLAFGLSFQGQALLGLLRESLVPVFVSATLGHAAVGGIFFARMLASWLIHAVYMLQRLLMPMFARLQGRPADLSRGAGTALFAVAALIVPVQATLWVLQEPVVGIVFGERWLAWLPVYRWLWLASLLEPQLVVGLALLNALGRADRTFAFLAATTALLWMLAVPLLLLLGPSGFGIAAVLLLPLKWKLVREIDRAVGSSSVAIVAPIWIAAIVGAAAIWLLGFAWMPSGLASLALYAGISLAISALVLRIAARERCDAAVAWLRTEIRRAAAPPLVPAGARR